MSTQQQRGVSRRPLIHLLARGLAVVAMLTAAVVVPGAMSAQAADPDRSGRTVAAPQTSTAGSAVATAAASPSTSPKPYRVRTAGAKGTFSCAKGNLCVSVVDPTTKSTKVFDLYYCDTYALANWYGEGRVVNAQSAGSVAEFLDQKRVRRAQLPPGRSGSLNWDSIWYIRNC